MLASYLALYLFKSVYVGCGMGECLGGPQSDKFSHFTVCLVFADD